MLLRTAFVTVAFALTGSTLPCPIHLPRGARNIDGKPNAISFSLPMALPPLPFSLTPSPRASSPPPLSIRALSSIGLKAAHQNLLPRVDDTTVVADPQNVTITSTTPSFPTAVATVPDTNDSFLGGANLNTENDLLDGKKGCTEFTVIFARGTTESGNVGTSTGPPFFAALKKEVGAENVAVQGVDYPADIPGFLAGGSPEGSSTMANLIQQAVSKCPESKVIISGYSQGAQLVHNAAKILLPLPNSVISKVSGAVLFGDPDDGEPIAGLVPNETLVICHEGDLICDHTVIVTPAHLKYDQNAGEAANFVASRETFALYDLMPV